MIILGGAVCIPTLPVSMYPALAPPQVSVVTNYVGANADTRCAVMLRSHDSVLTTFSA